MNRICLKSLRVRFSNHPEYSAGTPFCISSVQNHLKTGRTAPTISLLSTAPVANIILLFYLAFGRWPVLKDQRPPQSADVSPDRKKTGHKALVIIGTVLLFLAPAVVITGTVYTLTLPKLYASQARIQINTEPADPCISSLQECRNPQTAACSENRPKRLEDRGIS